MGSRPHSARRVALSRGGDGHLQRNVLSPSPPLPTSPLPHLPLKQGYVRTSAARSLGTIFVPGTCTRDLERHLPLKWLFAHVFRLLIPACPSLYSQQALKFDQSTNGRICFMGNGRSLRLICPLLRGPQQASITSDSWRKFVIPPEQVCQTISP